ncbi:MAG: LacI family DNA-binding transcriptional regulator [Lachnospiraceae bacterium]|nr:LacI family DNA-binding transcriptional regulator [Lachnospiraceae bacterium]
MAKTVKLADIAEKFGVSVVTVSKALSGQKGVSEEMRERIVSYADELGYVQPSVARQREKTVSYNIGVLVREGYLGEDSFYWKMYRQVAENAVERGCFSMLEVINTKMEERLMLPKLLTEGKADGIIVIGALGERYLGKLLKEADAPVVFMDFNDKKQKSDGVISDSFYGAYRMTNYLIDNGHTRIAYVGTVGATGSITDRYLGYLKSLIENGLELREDWIIDDREDENGAIGEGGSLKLPKDMPSAFFCNCDLTAAILIKKLQKEGYRVPEDISVAGYDDHIYTGMCDVKLTTYAVDVPEMARQAVSTLIKKVGGERYHKGTHVIEGKIVVRDSVRKKRH